MPASSAAPIVTDLTSAEQAWIAESLGVLQDAGITNIDSLGMLYDERLLAWLAAPDEQRSDPNGVINLLGVGFGEFVRLASDTRWVMAEDQHGTELALHGEPGNILMFPQNMVAKRWVAHEVGALPALASATTQAIEEFRRRAED